MKVSGKLYVLAALHPGKNPVPTEQLAGYTLCDTPASFSLFYIS